MMNAYEAKWDNPEFPHTPMSVTKLRLPHKGFIKINQFLDLFDDTIMRVGASRVHRITRRKN